MREIQYNLKNEIKNETKYKIFDCAHLSLFFRDMTLKADKSLFCYLFVLGIKGWKKGPFAPAK